MIYYSLNHQSPEVNFEEATIRGQAPDKGLYFPKQIPLLPNNFIKNIRQYSKEEIGETVMAPFIDECIPEVVLQQIIAETINFNIPLVKVTENSYVLELFHGPTLAFKDVGARFMSRCLGYFNRNANHHVTILVATSGDTGGAVANGFLGVEGVNVIILYPSGKVSEIQELQLTTLGNNIKAIEVQGTFDDCQAMVKQAFTDADLNKKFNLTSANSINVARWLPQQLYYFFAYQQWQLEQPPVISVPSGNFGNICAGILAHASGLPVQYFIAACNANNTIPNFLQTGVYRKKEAVPTLSNAMDVGDPSNFIRILEIFHHQLPELKGALKSISVSDDITFKTIKEVFEKYHYILDPHGAVSYYALQQFLSGTHDKGIFLETAHPVKFPDVVEKAIGKTLTFPEQVKDLRGKQKQSTLMPSGFENLKEWMLGAR